MRESPTLANVHLFPLMTAQVKVVPEKSVSMEGSKYDTILTNGGQFIMITSQYFIFTCGDNIN